LWFTKEENTRGDLSVGKLADLVVLSDDYFSTELTNIKQLHSLMTWVDGKRSTKIPSGDFLLVCALMLVFRIFE
jgi:predicted amidohydrolase YtcJ